MPTQEISIHALLAESDLRVMDDSKSSIISIHALLAESDQKKKNQPGKSKFLSTLSLRRATNASYGALDGASISIHALLAESDIHHRTRRRSPSISIHALLAESDFWRNRQNKDLYLFLSTLSLRRATGVSFRDLCAAIFLSTLSLRRATYPLLFWGEQHGDFYPRSPCGERPSSVLMALPPYIFLSTLSLRRATPNFRGYIGGNIPFLSTLSLRRATFRRALKRPVAYFYPRSPCGERLLMRCRLMRNRRFLSTLSLRRATQWRRSVKLFRQFLSTLSLRRATTPLRTAALHIRDFYPRSPCGERRKIRNPSRPGKINFYPRSPCGERLTSVVSSTGTIGFLSTLSLRRATVKKTITFYPPIFLSTLSLRRATRYSGLFDSFDVISIHALLAESDNVTS